MSSPEIGELTEWEVSQQVAFFQALGTHQCHGCGAEIGDALAACPDCFNEIPEDERAELLRTAVTDRDQALRDTKDWFKKNRK